MTWQNNVDGLWSAPVICDVEAKGNSTSDAGSGWIQRLGPKLQAYRTSYPVDLYADKWAQSIRAELLLGVSGNR